MFSEGEEGEEYFITARRERSILQQGGREVFYTVKERGQAFERREEEEEHSKKKGGYRGVFYRGEERGDSKNIKRDRMILTK